MLTAFWTGLTFVAYAALVPTSVTTIVCTQHRAQAFALIAVVMCLVTSAASVLYVGGKQYSAHVVYAQAIEKSVTGASVEEIDADLLQAQSLFASDLYVAERVRLRLATAAPLLSLTEPTAADEQRFGQLLLEARELSELAIALDRTQPTNHALLAGMMALAAQGGGGTEALDRSLSSMGTAESFDPQNPEYQTLNALLLARLGESVRAREALLAAIGIKQNYTDALFLLSQLDIQEGKTESAIALTQAIISIEPRNPTRYFQLGALLAANNDLPNAIAAFELAVQLDPNFANARYLLALAYIDSNEIEAALRELRLVLELNPDNQELPVLISQLESGDFVRPSVGLSTPVTDPAQATEREGVTTSSEVPDTDLLNPINRTASDGTSTETSSVEEELDSSTGNEQSTTTLTE
jgi:tetratricopeptide (TPR) repeat protein